jgi:hypothetical protein
MLNSISTLINKNISSVELGFSKFEELIEKNDLISLNKSQSILDDIRIKLENNVNLINSCSRISNTMNSIISVLKSLPIPTAPFPVTVGLILTLSDTLNYLSKKIEDITNYINIVDKIISNQQSVLESSYIEIHEIDERYKELSNSKNIIKQNEKLTNFKGYDIYIREEMKDSFKKHYGVAVLNGKEIIKTDSSYLTDSEILINKVKYLINRLL